LLCVAGYDGYLKKINPAVSKLLGYTNEELLSKPINDFVYSLTKKTLLQLEMILEEGVFI
jgi:PAS domain S-box-containing protein